MKTNTFLAIVAALAVCACESPQKKSPTPPPFSTAALRDSISRSQGSIAGAQDSANREGGHINIIQKDAQRIDGKAVIVREWLNNEKNK